MIAHGASHGGTPATSLHSAGNPAKAPTTTAPTTTTTTTLPPPGPGFVAGQVTAVGDSVMLDYQTPLQAAVPGISVDAAVSRQWDTGISILEQLKAQGQLGAKVVVALSTNGPITDADFDQMMSVLSGASRVVFVNDHVDQPWQDPNNAVLAAGAARYHNVVIADWATMAAQNPSWFGADGTHLAINGPGTAQRGLDRQQVVGRLIPTVAISVRPDGCPIISRHGTSRRQPPLANAGRAAPDHSG